MGEERSASATTSDKRQLPAAAHQLPAAARQLPAAARQLSATRPRRPTISACLIVKNEEANLGRCLRSLKGKVDEVIVVDTGSTDGTVEIARQGGARVAYFPWCDDFSAARNESLKLAASDFIIWIDADEELIEHKPGALAKLAASLAADVHGCWLACESLRTEDGEIGSVSRQWRLVRNHIGAHFQGRIHEQLSLPPSAGDVRLLIQNDVLIRHWGYIPKGDRLQQKADRNRPMLERAVRDEPANAFYRYSLGKHYAGEGRFDDAYHEMWRAIDAWRELGSPVTTYAAHMFAVAALAAVETARYQEAVRIFEETPKMFRSADLLLQAGLAKWQSGSREEAIACLRRAHEDPSLRDGFESEPSCATWRPLLALAHIHAEMEQLDQAHDYARRALDYAPQLPSILYPLAFLAARRGDHGEAIEWARRLLAPVQPNDFQSQARRILFNIGLRNDDPELLAEACAGEVEGIAAEDAVLRLAEAHGRLGNLQTQYDTLDAGCQAHPANPDIRLALAALLEREGYAQQAIAVLSAGIDAPRPDARLYDKLAALLLKSGQPEDAGRALEIAERLRAGESPAHPYVAPSTSGNILSPLGEAW